MFTRVPTLAGSLSRGDENVGYALFLKPYLRRANRWSGLRVDWAIAISLFRLFIGASTGATKIGSANRISSSQVRAHL
jgi:hypothetical protein